MKKSIVPLLLLLSLFAACGLPAQTPPTPIRLAGSVTLAHKLAPKQAEIEAATGQKLEVVGNTVVRGLLAVADGSADIGLAGGPWDALLADTMAKNPGKIDPTALKITPLAPTKLVVITNASSGITSLTLAQFSDLLTGKVKNWKEVGGADVPVTVVTYTATNGFRVVIQQGLLKGGPFAPSSREIVDPRTIPTIVAQMPGVLSYTAVDMPLVPGDVSVTTDQPLPYPLELVTLKAASPTVNAVVAAVVTALK